jgi:type II secretory pathway component PulF
MAPERSWKTLDVIGSVAVGLVLLVFGGWCTLEIVQIPRQLQLFADLGTTLPLLTQFVVVAAEFKVLQGLAILLLLGGFGCLFGVRDRLRANVYALVAAMLMGAIGALARLAISIPLFHVMSELGA